jgi:hypothetical protein
LIPLQVPHLSSLLLWPKNVVLKGSHIILTMSFLLVAILPSAVISQSPPITDGYTALYNSNSWAGALPSWSTARLSVARFYLVATAVGKMALFAGGDLNGT